MDDLIYEDKTYLMMHPSTKEDADKKPQSRVLNLSNPTELHMNTIYSAEVSLKSNKILRTFHLGKSSVQYRMRRKRECEM